MNIRKILASTALIAIASSLFVGCEATQVGNFDGTGTDSGLSNLPHARHEGWETDARYGNLPGSR